MTHSSAPSSLVRRILIALGCFALLFLIAAIYFFFHAGEWLVREDPLEKSHAILVLSGGLPDRALAAAKIYRDGFAREVWVTQPIEPAASMQLLHLPYAGEEEYTRMVLISQGVPTYSIRILKPTVANTADEMRAVAAALDEQPGSTAIVVTSKAHTRRVHTLWNEVSAGHSGHLIIRGSTKDTFDAAHWWRTTNDALTVVREYLALLNAWAGLPLPHTKPR